MNYRIFWDQERLKAALRLQSCHNFEAATVCIDSRKVEKKSIFIGLKGRNFDGGVFAEAAMQQGAVTAIVNKSVNVSGPGIIAVDDTEQALTDMAVYRRNHFPAHVKVIGVTGSAGKTSTKEMISLVLRSIGKTYATLGNLNNHLGLPLTISNMPDDTDFCIVEMGMSNKGEISHLTRIAKPDVAVITTVAPAHLEFFQSVEEIALAKSEIFQGMQAGAHAVLNLDNGYYEIMKEAALRQGLNIVTFGQSENADIRLVKSSIENHKTNAVVSHKSELYRYYFPVLVGKHLVQNSAAALAVAQILGGDLQRASNMLANFVQVTGRGSVQLLKNKIVLINDSYNANPASVKAALQNIEEYKTKNCRTIAILGDMRELGERSAELHAALAAYTHNIDLVHTAGYCMLSLHQALSDKNRGVHHADAELMSDFILNELQEGDVVLVKGSFVMNMAKVVAAIQQKFSL